MKGITTLALIFTLAGASSATAQVQPACDRACLTRFVDTFFKALETQAPDTVPLASSARVTTNGRVGTLAEAFWKGAGRTACRLDIVNPRLGDTGTEAIVVNADGSRTMYLVRLKVLNGRITEVETIRTNKTEAGGLWGAEAFESFSPEMRLPIREADQDSYYGLIAAAEGYWRAFQTSGTPAYHRAPLLPDARRYENGLPTTGFIRDGALVSAAADFDTARFIGRNLWDRRYPVVDTERGIVLSIVRFGMKAGMTSQSAVTSHDRLVGEFFAVKGGLIQEIHAVLFDLPETDPTGWPAQYGPGRGGR